MKHLLMLFLVPVLAWQSCKSSSQQYGSRMLSLANLDNQTFDINTTRDTILQTRNGAVLRISARSLQGPKEIVKLAVREAYTIQDMVAARLTTMSDGKPLASGGMIFIGATDNQVKLKGNISVSIPVSHIMDGMEAYRGVLNNDSTINWTDAKPLTSNASSERLAIGKALFNANCASCHNPLKEATGPALIHMQQRRTWNWLAHFTSNPSEMIANGDPIATCLFNKYKPTVMTGFPTLSDTELHQLYDYLENVTWNAKSSEVSSPSLACYDSCRAYYKARARLSIKRDSFINGNNSSVLLDVTPPSQFTTDGPSAQFEVNSPSVASALPADKKVVPQVRRGIYYQIEVTAFGWWNVDMLLQTVSDIQESKLFVRLQGAFAARVSLFFILPKEQTYLEGGPLEGTREGLLGFYRKDGSIPLPQGSIGYIMAVGETGGRDERLLFAMQSFSTSLDQTITLTPVTATAETIKAAIAGVQINGLDIKVASSKNASEIRAADVALDAIERLRPVSCDCECFAASKDTVVVKMQ